MRKIVCLGLATLLSYGSCSTTPEKPKFLWIDASANYERLSSEEKVTEILDKVKEVGFTAIIVDLKPISGEVLYPSELAPQIKEWRGFSRDENFDYTQTMINAARKRKLKVYASMNVFAEGWKNVKRGLIYTTHPEWQTMLYTPDSIMPTTKSNEGYSAFVNPALPEVQEHEIDIMKEIIGKYDFDGLVLDRARYDNIKSDFSDFSRNAFEKFMGAKVENWPQDIFVWKEDEEHRWSYRRGRYFQDWILWRATVIHDFFEKSRKELEEIKPEIDFVTYAGAWYPSYFELGVNWASETYNPAEEYDWALPQYYQTGYAEQLDFLFTGNYFYRVTIAEADSANRMIPKVNPEAGLEEEIKSYHTVEGSAKVTGKVIQGKIPVYGSLYVQQYKDKDDPEQFSRAIRMLLRETDGIMIFDLVHIDSFDWWELLRETFSARQ